MGKNNKERRKQKKRDKIARNKRRRERASAKRSESIAPVIQKIPNPLEGLTDDQRRKAIDEIASNAERIFQESLAALKEAVSEYDPLILLSVASTYGLTAGVSESSGVNKLDSEYQIYQAHAELLQALALQVSPSHQSRTPPGQDAIQGVWDALRSLTQAQDFRRLRPEASELSEAEKAVALIQGLMRVATRMVRNWGYHSQVKRITRELYSPFDDKVLEKRGFTITNIMDLFEIMMKEIGRKSTQRFDELSELFRASGKDNRTLVRRYHELVDQAVDPDEFLREIGAQQAPFDGLFAWLMSQYDLRLPETYTFDPTDLAGSLELNVQTVSAIFQEYSMRWGALEAYETEHIFLANPVWTKPLIDLQDGRYFCSIPGCFFSFVIPCLESVLSNSKPAVSDRRAQYLEDRVAEILAGRFPASSTVRNLTWMADGTTYETDLITFIDSFALIIECKSGKVSPPALRGAPDRLRRHIEELLIEPNIQSSRLKARLEMLAANPEIEDPIRGSLPIDPSNVRRVIRVSVCLEDFGPIQSNLKRLGDTGWLPDGFEPCPTMNLADFETVFDILEHPVQILHYLLRREAIETTVGYLADEIDLLGLYLSTLLNIGDIPPDTHLGMTGMSAPIDIYYNSRDAGVLLDKPAPMITPLFASIFSQLEKRDQPRWTEMGVALNMLSPDDQRGVTRELRKLEKNVDKNWRKEGHKNMIVVVPPKASEYALAYVMFKDENMERRQEFMEHAASFALEQAHVHQVVVIARNIDRNDDRAYHTIGLFWAADA